MPKKSLFPENWLTLSSSSKTLLVVVLAGIILVGLGVFFYKSDGAGGSTKVEILNDSVDEGGKEITVEIAGEVANPGVYKLPAGARVDDLLVASGGLSAGADREGISKYLNRAAVLTDGQKVYIPSQTQEATAKNSDYIKVEQPVLGVSQEGATNINTASLAELDKLPGIGPVYGQSIIDHRPYSNTEELVSKGALKKSVYEKIKDMVSIY